MYPDYDTITQRLTAGKLYSFPGGVHPEDRKTLSNQQAIARASLPGELIIPIRQHIGTQGRLRVEVGQHVKKGEPLTTSAHPFAIPVHAPTSGTVCQISDRTIAHPSGLSEPTVTLEPDGEDKWIELTPLGQYKDLPAAEVVEALCNAGISGMGGAGFPTHIKAGNTKEPEFLIINGAECEPYISADDRLMREHAWQVRQGIDVLQHLISSKLVIVAIEDNKPEALEAMQIACQDKPQIKVVSVPTKYPAGGEKQLIQAVTGREVPREGLPADIGVVMFNVGTCYAVADAVFQGKPLVERVVTLTGEALDKPQNVWALIGTPINHLLGYAGYNGNKQTLPQVIMGGPMMGFTLNDAQVPVVKITNCILVPATGELTQGEDERACIRCSACADACPASLLPQQIFWHAKAHEYDKAEEYDLFDCIECGACAYVCPSEIPLVHYYRQAKAEIRVQRDEKAKAEKAKERFEARKARLEREKLEREEKHRKAKEARTAAASGKSSEASKDKVAAALARAKAKKQQTDTQSSQASSSDAAPQGKKEQVSAAIARAKAKKAAQQAEATGAKSTPHDASTNEQDGKPNDKKAQVAAAVARAKAKKKAREDAEHSENGTAETNKDGDNHPQAESEPNDKKAQVAAAVARAKAKKEAREDVEHSENGTAETNKDGDNDPQAESARSPATDKKAQVAAAVARAKAKKEARQAEHRQGLNEPPHVKGQQCESSEGKDSESGNGSESEQSQRAENSEPVQSEGPQSEKQRRIAAAVARAKAKKALQSNTMSNEETKAPAQSPQPSDRPGTAQEATSATSDAQEQKQQRIAAAVAKAKAKKAQQARKDDADTTPDTAPSNNEPASKSDRIAAAVAKAKAKQAARKAASDENDD